MSLREMTLRGVSIAEPVSWGGDGGTNILVLEMLEQLQFSVGPLCQDGSAEGLHYLLDGDILAGELVSCRTVSREHLLDPSTSLPAGNNSPNQTKSTHSNGLQIRVPRGNLKGSPEDLCAYEFGHDG